MKRKAPPILDGFAKRILGYRPKKDGDRGDPMVLGIDDTPAPLVPGLEKPKRGRKRPS